MKSMSDEEKDLYRRMTDPVSSCPRREYCRDTKQRGEWLPIPLPDKCFFPDCCCVKPAYLAGYEDWAKLMVTLGARHAIPAKRNAFLDLVHSPCRAEMLFGAAWLYLAQSNLLLGYKRRRVDRRNIRGQFEGLEKDISSCRGATTVDAAYCMTLGLPNLCNTRNDFLQAVAMMAGQVESEQNKITNALETLTNAKLYSAALRQQLACLGRLLQISGRTPWKKLELVLDLGIRVMITAQGGE